MIPWAKFLTTRAASNLGRRGAVLLTLGFCWILFGLSVIGEQLGFAPGYDPGLLHLMIPDPIRIFLWMSTGFIAITYAWRPAHVSDAVGFVALVIMPAERAVSYFWGWIVWMTGPPGDGFERGLVQGMFWLAFLLLIHIASGWSEPTKVSATQQARELKESRDGHE